ncbi:MAG: hypothetical protein R2813_13475 [Flavobacteriales bacterium]
MRKLAYIFPLVLFTACATYYQRNIEFQELIGKGSLDKAEKLLESDKKIQRDRNRLLFLFNMGYINHMQQEFSESNKYFNEADLLIEDYKKSYGAEALALVSNPEVKPYKAEDFEEVMIHYYKAINYLMLRDFDASLVEARRMNLTLNRLNDKYKDHKNRYQADAFANIIMGLAYEATGNINDAFIAYRNAYEVYTGEHGYFDTPVPEQLKEDLLRTANSLGFRNDLEFYEREFDRKYSPRIVENGEVVFIWQNGMGPVKDEMSINFFAVPGAGGVMYFENEDLGLSFPFFIGNDQQKKNDLLALHVIRVAFPKYIERPNFYKSAYIQSGAEKHELELAENINDIAFKTLHDRFMREMGVALLRLALKKVAEVKLSQENALLGAAATITNAVTEKADTRNWQTLPHSVYYTRVPLNSGNNELVLKMKNVNQAQDQATFQFEGKRGAMYFQPYHSIEHLPAAGWDSGAPHR